MDATELSASGSILRRLRARAASSSAAMSKSFLAAVAARAVDARLTETSQSESELTVLVGAEGEAVRVRIDGIPPDTFLGALLRQQSNFDGTTSLAENSAEFLRLLARFWDSAPPPSTPKAFDEFEIIFGTFGNAYAPLHRLRRAGTAPAMAAFAPRPAPAMVGVALLLQGN